MMKRSPSQAVISVEFASYRQAWKAAVVASEAFEKIEVVQPLRWYSMASFFDQPDGAQGWSWFGK